jgi:hypothetical protein
MMGHGFGGPFGWGLGRHGSWSSLSSFGSVGSFGSFGSFDWNWKILVIVKKINTIPLRCPQLCLWWIKFVSDLIAWIFVFAYIQFYDIVYQHVLYSIFSLCYYKNTRSEWKCLKAWILTHLYSVTYKIF